MENVEITIIGAGIIGLSIAAEASKISDSVFVLERNTNFGMETSSRNSEVIHAGIYYPKDSLKAKTCLEGNHLLYEICENNNIPYKKTGKFIVAVCDSEIKDLENLFENAKNNGALDLELIFRDKIREQEPNIEAKAAIFSPSTGIVDSHSLMKYFLFKAKNNGAEIAFKSEVKNIERTPSGYRVTIVDSAGELFSFLTNVVINCAGLESDNVAKSAGIDIKSENYVLKYSKGQYFKVCEKKSNLVQRLIYPVPASNSSGLGIHATPNLGGSLRLGPDDKYIPRDRIDYDVDISDKDKFYQSIVFFLPFLELDDLTPDMSGIRPKLQGENEGFRDFVIKEESDLGLPGFINLIGIESPGLTSAPAIAKYVGNILTRILNH